MASIAVEPNGRRRILFVGSDGKRRTIRLGKVSQRQAEAVNVRIEALVFASISGQAPDDETARWLADRDDKFRDKLVRAGLAVKRQAAPESTLEPFLESYITTRTAKPLADAKVKRKTMAAKQSTATVWGHTKRNLIKFFGATKPLRDITGGDADEWRLFLSVDEELAENTVRRRCGIAKQFFKAATKKRLIAENPFAELDGMTVRGNRQRDYFLSREDAAKVLDKCPDAEWRLLFALSRYGGLRCPSEHLRLQWTDIDWEGERMTIHASKTEHHDDGGIRVVPIFPELRPYLDAVYFARLEAEEAGRETSEFVITRYRHANVNLRTQLLKIIKRAGLKPWPKLFQNLRSTRETELAATHPLYVVCEWIGNSKLIAQEHYLQVTDADFQKAAQNPAQQAHETPRNASQEEGQKCEKPRISRGFSTKKVGDTGLEPVTSTMSTWRSNQLS